MHTIISLFVVLIATYLKSLLNLNKLVIKLKSSYSLDETINESTNVTGKWSFVLGENLIYFGFNQNFNTPTEAFVAGKQALKHSIGKNFTIAQWVKTSNTLNLNNVIKYTKQGGKYNGNPIPN